MTTTSLRDRLSRHIGPCPDEGCECILWRGAKNPKGYGLIREGARGSRMLRVHRVAWELQVGPIPDGLQIDHVKARGCRHRNCVNLAHLEPVTLRENIRRGDVGKWRLAITHCPRNHPYDEVNTYVPPRRNARMCRECDRIRQRMRSGRTYQPA